LFLLYYLSTFFIIPQNGKGGARNL